MNSRLENAKLRSVDLDMRSILVIEERSNSR